MSSFAPGTDPRVMAEFERRFYGARVPGMVQGAEAQVTPQLAVRDAGRVDDYNRMVSGIPGFPSFNAARTVGGQTLGSMPSGNAGLSSDAMTPEGQQMLANLKLPEYRVPPPADMQPQQRFNPYQQQRFNPYQQFQQFQQQQFNPYQQFQQQQFNPFMGGLGGLFSQMGGYGMGYNPMMGGFGGFGNGFGGFGNGFGGYNPMMGGGGFGGGFNPMMGGQGFGGGMQQGNFAQPQGGSSPFGGGFGGGFGSRGYMNQMSGSAPAGQAAGFGMY
jgi:hypothetical protein